MSKYINTEDLHKVVLKRKTEYGSLADLIDNIVEEMVKETPYADVVERSKVDKVIEEIKEKSYLSYDSNPRRILDEECVLEILKRNIGE